jgi:glycerol-3-phosphate O-acyltransferase
MAWDIVPAFNPYFYFRAGYRMARKCLRALYKLRVAFVDKDSMADVSDQAAVIFIINHRSNIDYAVANYLTASRTMLSFGVGEWSRVWPIQPFMRMAGGYFVRRDSGDPLYRLMLKRYVQMATDARVPHAIFLEGQLSPDGSVGEAKLGLLSYVTEHFEANTGPDLVFIPIGINYDRIPEDQNMVRYSSSDFRAKGRRYVLLQGVQFAGRVCWELIRSKRAFGYVCAHFGRPVSFSRWLIERNIDWTGLSRKERYGHVCELGRKLIDDIVEIVPATPVSILCRVWFDDPKLVLCEQELLARFSQLCAALSDNGCHVLQVHENIADTLAHALALTRKRNIIECDSGGNYRLNSKNQALAKYSGNSLSQFF